MVSISRSAFTLISKSLSALASECLLWRFWPIMMRGMSMSWIMLEIKSHRTKAGNGSKRKGSGPNVFHPSQATVHVKMSKKKQKGKEEKNKDKIIETLYAELERRDKLIDKLKEENMLLLKTSLKSSERLKELEEKLRK